MKAVIYRQILKAVADQSTCSDILQRDVVGESPFANIMLWVNCRVIVFERGQVFFGNNYPQVTVVGSIFADHQPLSAKRLDANGHVLRYHSGAGSVSVLTSGLSQFKAIGEITLPTIVCWRYLCGELFRKLRQIVRQFVALAVLSLFFFSRRGHARFCSVAPIVMATHYNITGGI